MENNNNTAAPRDFEIEQRLRDSLVSSYRRKVTLINVRHFSLVALLLALAAWYILSIAVDTVSVTTTVPGYRQHVIQCLERITSAL